MNKFSSHIENGTTRSRDAVAERRLLSGVEASRSTAFRSLTASKSLVFLSMKFSFEQLLSIIINKLK